MPHHVPQVQGLVAVQKDVAVDVQQGGASVDRLGGVASILDSSCYSEGPAIPMAYLVDRRDEVNKCQTTKT